MDTPGDRRAFFKDLFGSVAKGALQIAPSLGHLERLAPSRDDDHDSEDALEPDFFDGPPQPASPSTKTATIVDLLRMAQEAGLAFRAPEIQALAQQSLRLTLGDDNKDTPGRSRFGGEPDLPAALEWPNFEDQPLTFLLQIDLAQLAALGVAGALPDAGVLLFFVKTDDTPSGLQVSDRGSGAVIVVEEPTASIAQGAASVDPDIADAVSAAVELSLSGEMTLPRLWTQPVEALELEPEEEAGWHDLREQLAAFQGVELEDISPNLNSLHRFLGHPDETRGDMPLVCELTAAGIDADDQPRAHPRIEEFQGPSQRWRLLLQLTIDDDLGWSWGSDRDRLYFWIDADDWQAGDLSRVWIVAE